MIQKKQNATVNSKNTDTIIGEGIIFEKAMLKGAGVIRVDGKFSGTIDIDGHIILGERGSINGEITVDSALFAGKYQGNLCVKGTLHMTSTAILTGRVDAGKLIMDEGAKLSGTCNVTSGEALEPIVNFEHALEAESSF
ncbi:MAG: polymer-forming cytoskeletal protein [Oscillospiraceae bacterium]|nr:polymer-forming cytoskeletal protein [Oscillospiraceae bacterium]